MARSNASARAKRGSVVVAVRARAADDDLVGLERHDDLALARPVLGVDGVVGDGGVEPQAVALLAVVEGPLEARLAGRAAARAAAAAAAPAPALGPLAVVALVVGLGLLVLAGLGAARGLGLELGGDQRVVLGAQVDLVVEVDPGRVAGLAVRQQVVLLLERLDLLDGDLELVSDPGVRAALSDPRANLVEMRTERSSGHLESGILLDSDPRASGPHVSSSAARRRLRTRFRRKVRASPSLPHFVGFGPLACGHRPCETRHPVAGALGGVQPCSY